MKIELGKFYRSRNGDKIGPMVYSGNPVYPFLCTDSGTYAENGSYNLMVDEHYRDLIEEWREPADESGQSPGFEAHTVDVAQMMNIGGQVMHKGMLVQLVEHRNPITFRDEHTATGYEPLAGVLQEAHDQAASGKGKERHANGKPFTEQPIMAIGRMCGLGFQTGQIQKKVQEATGMAARGETDAAIRELLGAINYAAAAVLLIREQKSAAQ